MQDLRQTPQFAQYLKSLGWQVSRCSITDQKPFMYLRKIPALGVIVKLQRPEGKIKFDEIQKLIGKYKIGAFYIEPSSAIENIPEIFHNSKNAFLPAKTLIIDLKKSENQLLMEMKPKTRYNIKIAQKRGVIVKVSKDIESFSDLWKSSALKRGMWLSQKKEIEGMFKHFGKKAMLLMAYKDTEPIGGVLIAFSLGAAFYMYAGATKSGKQLFAPTLLAWEAIKLSKKKGLNYFDFEGVFDERYPQTKNWKGFTHFKEGFGGKVVEYPKSLVYFRTPFHKLLSF